MSRFASFSRSQMVNEIGHTIADQMNEAFERLRYFKEVIMSYIVVSRKEDGLGTVLR